MTRAITLAGKVYTLVPSYTSLTYIEQNTGLGIIALSRQLVEGMLPLTQLASMIASCAEPAGELTQDAVGQWLAGGELATGIDALAAMLAGVLDNTVIPA